MPRHLLSSTSPTSDPSLLPFLGLTATAEPAAVLLGEPVELFIDRHAELRERKEKEKEMSRQEREAESEKRKNLGFQ